jgi:hypothetical protein
MDASADEADDPRMSRWTSCLHRRGLPEPDLHEHDHVRITAGVLRGRTGTLVRPARVVVDAGWMVQLDGRPLGLRRLRVATWALAPADEAARAA